MIGIYLRLGDSRTGISHDWNILRLEHSKSGVLVAKARNYVIIRNISWNASHITYLNPGFEPLICHRCVQRSYSFAHHPCCGVPLTVRTKDQSKILLNLKIMNLDWTRFKKDFSACILLKPQIVMICRFQKLPQYSKSWNILSPAYMSEYLSSLNGSKCSYVFKKVRPEAWLRPKLELMHSPNQIFASLRI